MQRIRTSSMVASNLDKMQSKLKVSTKASILRICISISLNNSDSPINVLEGFESKEGFDISLQTLFGEQDILYKAMIKCHAQKPLSDEEYGQYIIAHIERGMIDAYADFVMTNSLSDFIAKLEKSRC